MTKTIPPEKLSRIEKILIIQYKPFGDVLLNTGCLPALRAAFPDAVIDYLVQKPYATILENNACIDNIIVMNKLKTGTMAYTVDRIHLISRIRREHYDVVIDQARGPGAAEITLFSGAGIRIGWHKTKKWSWFKGHNWVYNYRELKNHNIYSARAKFGLLRPLGIHEIPHNTYIHVLPESENRIQNWFDKQDVSGKNIAVFSPVTPIRSRQWNFGSFAAVADMLIEKHGFTVVLLWGPGEKKKVEHMASLMKYQPLTAPPTSFNEAAAMLKRARVYFGNNGGVHHLAVAVGTPTVTVFGPGTSPLKWTAWHMPQHTYLISTKLKEYVDNTFGIGPEMVFEEFEKLLESGAV
jgi:ADP-heptose:LPS heptosyltransferase